MAIVASIFVHGALLVNWRGVFWLPTGTKWADERVSGEGLTVLLKSRRTSDVSSAKVDEILVSPASFLKEAPASELHDGRVAVPESGQFLASSHLSVVAQPLTDIQIPWPSGLPVMGVKSAIFTIFIDEFGIVKDVVPDGQTLSPAMEEGARRAFLEALFRPAMLNGQAVKSMKRIEVEFEFLPTQSPQNIPEIVGRKELN